MAQNRSCQSYTPTLCVYHIIQVLIQAVAAPEFLGCWGTARAPEFRLGHLQIL